MTLQRNYSFAVNAFVDVIREFGGNQYVQALQKMLLKIDKNKLWINPDCVLKTRGIAETTASLKNLFEAAKLLRKQI